MHPRRPQPAPEVSSVASVAVLAPVAGCFDYAVPPDTTVVRGDRVCVPFGSGTRTGVIVDVSPVAVSAMQGRPLKALTAVLAPSPCLPESLLRLIEWAAGYYLHPMGEAFAAALPAALRRPQDAALQAAFAWRLCPAGIEAVSEARGVRQRVLMTRLGRGLLPETELADFDFDARSALRRMRERGWVERVPCDTACALSASVTAGHASGVSSAVLREGQVSAVESIVDRGPGFHVTLLEGVTGSGKTEVYLALLDRILAQGRQGLVLVPEIGLAHSLTERFAARFGAAFTCYHSGLSEGARLAAWEAARRGEVAVVLGTRSAVWLPLPRLGLVVVDEEHDESFKQSEGFRYSGRDTAIVRAQNDNIPIVLGSATPALETLANVRRGRYGHVRLTERAIAARPNEVLLVDLRAERPASGIGTRLQTAIAETLARGEQTLIFVNRRGFAPTVLCQNCGKPIECRHCTAPMVYYRRHNRMHCHHCNATRALAPACDCAEAFEPVFLGAGTERVVEHLRERFPEARIERIDRDVVRSTRRRDQVFRDLREGHIDIAVGTRMIAKGHHFPKVTLVGVVDADSRLFSADFRSPERLAQGLEQVAGRAGRASLPGRVLVQTRNPDHPLFLQLFSAGYSAVADTLLARREATGLPPFSMLILVRADGRSEADALGFLGRVAEALERAFPVSPGMPQRTLLATGPFPAPLARKAGTHRAQLLLEMPRGGPLRARLTRVEASIRDVKVPRGVRWSVDVDPIEMG